MSPVNNQPLKSPLGLELQRDYDRLSKLIAQVSAPHRILKKMEGTGGWVSVSNLLSYQIGWGMCVIRWYDAGLKDEVPEMPGDGFSTWDYVAIARHFYQIYQYDRWTQQEEAFSKVVERLLAIVESEYDSGNLEKIGVWPWCTLVSGKEWPLSKWIQVNTCAPYKRACALIKNSGLIPDES